MSYTDKYRRTEIYILLTRAADYFDMTATELIRDSYIKPVNFNLNENLDFIRESKESFNSSDELITFDNGKNYYRWIDLYCIYADALYEIQTENYLNYDPKDW